MFFGVDRTSLRGLSPLSNFVALLRKSAMLKSRFFLQFWTAINSIWDAICVRDAIKCVFWVMQHRHMTSKCLLSSGFFSLGQSSRIHCSVCLDGVSLFTVESQIIEYGKTLVGYTNFSFFFLFLLTGIAEGYLQITPLHLQLWLRMPLPLNPHLKLFRNERNGNLAHWMMFDWI